MHFILATITIFVDYYKHLIFPYDMIHSLIHGDSGLGKTKLAETLRSHVVEDDGCEWTLYFVIYYIIFVNDLFM